MSAPEPGGPALRRFVAIGALLLATGALLWRGLDLQLNEQAFLKTQGEARSLRVVAIPATRGKIVDRHGEPLAISTSVHSVWVNPGEIDRGSPRWLELISMLELDSARTTRMLEQRAAREFVYLKRRVTPKVAAGVAAMALTGVHLRREHRRYYPLGEVGAHVLGFTNVDDIGQEGVELAFEPRLAGVSGAKRVLQDRFGRIVEDVESIRVARTGDDVTLSIDRRIQHLAYRALLAAVKRHRAQAGSVVVLDSRSGEILAMVNQPSYNPNRPSHGVTASHRNRAVTDVFEPGSAIKPFTIASALASALFRPDSRIDTRPGYVKVGKHTVRDIRDYGVIDLSTLIQKSSNVGATKVALAVAPRALWGVLSAVGFGVRTPSAFPGESAGVLRHFDEWGKIHQATLSFGYGLSVTALQLAQAYAVLANDGKLAELSFLKREASETAARAVLDSAVSAQVREMLEAVVGADGTGAAAHIPGYRVGGKTGTVRKLAAGGYAKDRYFSLFAGMAPMSEPRLVAVVVVDEPSAGKYYGGDVAAPIFASVVGGALRLLGVAPDDRAFLATREAPALLADAPQPARAEQAPAP